MSTCSLMSSRAAAPISSNRRQSALINVPKWWWKTSSASVWPSPRIFLTKVELASRPAGAAKSNTAGKKRTSDRTRLLLTLELAIILPAVSLMAFSVWNLHKIQRDKAIEAAIQRDFTYVLGFAEKKAWHKAAGILNPVRQEFPSCNSPGSDIKKQLDKILAEHPEFLYVALYDKDTDLLLWRFQERHAADEAWHKRLTDTMTMIDKWLPFEAPDMVHRVRVGGEKDEMPFGFEGGWVERDDDHYYWNFGYFIPAAAPRDDVS